MKKYLIDINKFKKIHDLDSGGFGLVYEVINIDTNDILAAKTIIKLKDDKYYKDMINREIKNMIKCENPTIVKLYGYSLIDFDGKPNVTIFMEYASKGSLASFLEKSRNGLLDVVNDNILKQKILIGIAFGMMHIHRHRIIHRDLKPANILINEYLNPLISDFGFSKFYINDNISQSQQCGTCKYRAPEVIKSNHYNGKADVYSFGILMYEVITEDIPFPEIDNKTITVFDFNELVVNKNYRPKFNKPIKKSIQKLIERCWSQDPNLRPTFEEIFQMLTYNVEFDEDVFDIGNNSDGDENKYYLDGVKFADIREYIEDIQSNDTFLNEFKIKEMIENAIDPLKKENCELKKKIKYIQEEKEEMKNQIDNIITEKEEMKNQIDNIITEKEEMKILIEDIQSQNEGMKKQIDNYIAEKNELITNISLMKNSQITIDMFNDLSFDNQVLMVTSLCDGKMKQYYEKILSLLSFLSKFKKELELIPFIKIISKKGHQFLNDIIKEKEIMILHEVTNNYNFIELLNSPEFNDLLFQLSKITFEIVYPSKSKLFNIIKEKKLTNNKIRIAIYLVKNHETSLNDNHQIDRLIIDKSLHTISDLPITVQINKFGCFNHCINLISVSFPNTLKEIGPNTFENCISLKQIIIPSSVTTIGLKAFANCVSMRKLIFEIPSSLNIIKDCAFYQCTSLQKVMIPSSVKKIGPKAFMKCTSLKQVAIKSSDIKIDAQCFDECICLTHVTIPSTIKNIPQYFQMESRINVIKY